MNKKLSSIQRIPVYRFYLGMFILVALCVLIFALSYKAGGASMLPPENDSSPIPAETSYVAPTESIETPNIPVAASPDVSPAEPAQTDAVPNLPQTDPSASPTTAIP